MACNTQGSSRRTVCVLSHHSLVLRELEQSLPADRFRIQVRKIAATPLRELDLAARTRLYVVDAQLPQPTMEDLVGSIVRQCAKSRVLVVGERFLESEAFRLLRLGVKGFVPYAELRDRLPLAVEIVASGGFWVPRALLSRFLDSVVAPSRGRLASGLSTAISGREREVLERLLENLSNKEIAEKLHISERTVKFHVSNLLSKFQLARRQDLILHCLGVASAEPSFAPARRGYLSA